MLILDDWGLSKLMAEQRRDLLEILEDRYDSRSTIVTSQLPLGQMARHYRPTLADAILDRLVHNAYKINLRGESKKKNFVDGTYGFRVTICKTRVAIAPRVATLTGLGGNLQTD